MVQLIRLLIVLLLVWLVIQAVRRLMAKRADTDAPAITEMLPCAHCGVHVPKSQVVMAEGKRYCSQAHMKADHDDDYKKSVHSE